MSTPYCPRTLYMTFQSLKLYTEMSLRKLVVYLLPILLQCPKNINDKVLHKAVFDIMQKSEFTTSIISLGSSYRWQISGRKLEWGCSEEMSKHGVCIEFVQLTRRRELHSWWSRDHDSSIVRLDGSISRCVDCKLHASIQCHCTRWSKGD